MWGKSNWFSYLIRRPANMAMVKEKKPLETLSKHVEENKKTNCTDYAMASLFLLGDPFLAPLIALALQPKG